MKTSNIVQIATFLAILASTAQAVACQRFKGYQDNGDGTITDPRTQLVWQKCYLGQTWNGTSCNGKVQTMSWFDAMHAAKNNKFLGKTDWRIPTVSQFQSIVDSGCTWHASGQQDPIITTLLAQIRLNESGKRFYHEVWTTDTTYQDSQGKIDEIYKSIHKLPPGPYYFTEFGQGSDVKPNFYPMLKSSNYAVRLIRGGNKNASDAFEVALAKEAYPTAATDFEKAMKLVEMAQRKKIEQEEPEQQREAERRFNSSFSIGTGVRSYLWGGTRYGYSGQVVSASFRSQTVRVKISNVDSGSAAHLNAHECSQNKYLEKYASVGMIIDAPSYCFGN